RAAAKLRPDVIVTDIVMPGLDGIAATVALTADRPDTRVVLVTAFNGPEMAERGYAAGGLAHVSKHRAGPELGRAVRAAARGERYVSPRQRPGEGPWNVLQWVGRNRGRCR